MGAPYSKIRQCNYYKLAPPPFYDGLNPHTSQICAEPLMRSGTPSHALGIVQLGRCVNLDKTNVEKVELGRKAPQLSRADKGPAQSWPIYMGGIRYNVGIGIRNMSTKCTLPTYTFLRPNITISNIKIHTHHS